ncbi:DUF6551 family protein [Oscillospiraceae bacterium 44-34]
MSYRKKHSPPKPEQQALFPPAEVEYSNPGAIRTLSTARLTSGLPYQRPVEQKNVDKLIRNWNSRELYPVIVSFRDGKFNVVDGQNRIAAMRQMAGGGDVIVPCMIYTGMTYEQEAELYAKLDKGKRPLTPRQHTKALVESGADARIMEIKCLVEDVGFVWALTEPTGEPFEIAPIRALVNAHQLLGGEAFARMLSLLAGAWQGTPNSLRASMLSGMALFVKTYEAELSDRAFIRRLSIVSPDEIIRLGRIETDVGLRFARIILDKYNGGSAELPYRFKR